MHADFGDTPLVPLVRGPSGEALGHEPSGDSCVPALTVIVISLGDDPRLARCLDALAQEALTPIELIVVENGAAGDAPPLPIQPAVRLRRAANPGFAAAVNEALAVSRGELVLTLNPDTTLLPGSLASARLALEADAQAGAIAFRLLRPDREHLDSAGIRLGLVRRPSDRGMGRTAEGLFLRETTVDAACMACALFRRRALEEARDGRGEIVDSRYFAYKEDVDLGWRLRRAGWAIRYLPGAQALHERGWREGGRREIPAFLRILSLRNRWLTIAKNETALSFTLRAALYVAVEAGVAAYLLLREPGTLRAYVEVLRELPETLRRRRAPAKTKVRAGAHHR